MEAVDLIVAHVASWRKTCGPLVIGLCGPQGSGKSTIAERAKAILTDSGLKAVTLSLDDLYLDHAARARLAAEIHPLFATRGPPGTHDVGLGIAVLDALRSGEPTCLPRFDKGSDNPHPQSEWPTITDPCDVILFEGWCIGAVPQDDAALINPINALERSDDHNGIWRRAVNAHLAGVYQQLWARIDRLILLTAPDFRVVHRWRSEQEQSLHARGAPAAMDDDAITRFIQHYERLSRHVAIEMPGRADLVITLDASRRMYSGSL
jgi:D-glycerate 3-kinase